MTAQPQYFLLADDGLKPELNTPVSVTATPRMRCEVCGASILRKGRARHERTQRHKDVEYLWNDRFEFK
jgi:DNA-directed RNA polymerase subunit RPC12/RpoP